ncbi:MAG: ECF-type sigma factor, partial [Phycisphaerae bacterium]
GDETAHEQLWRAVYDELYAAAQRQMAGERPNGTLHPTALVSETYLRLVGTGNGHFANRAQFFAAAAISMRHICIDGARKRGRTKRGNGKKPVSLEGDIGNAVVFDQDPDVVLAIDEALTKLEAIDECKARITMLRYFTGLSIEETAFALEMSERDIKREWRLARAWLFRELSKGDTRVSP